MRTFARWAVSVAVALAIGRAGAAPRLVVTALEGDDGRALEEQIGSRLCAEYLCVDPARVTSAGAIDFARVRQLAVSGVFTGAVQLSAGQRVAALSLLTRSASPVRQWRFELAGPELAPAQLDELVHDIASVLRASTEPTPIPEIVAPTIELAPTQPRPPVSPAPAGEQTEAGLAPAGEPFRRSEPVLAAEAGFDLTGRRLSFSGDRGVGGRPPFGYDAGGFARPRLRLEAYPGALLTDGALAGLGLYGDLGFSIGLETNPNTAGGAALPNRGTAFRQLDVGVLWRLRPARDSRWTLVPSFSYRQLRLKVDQPIPDLPDADLQGVEGALRAELAVWRGLSLVGGAGYVRWLRARELVRGSGYYPSGSAYALDLELGMAVRVAGPLSVRAVGEYLWTRYALDDPSGNWSSTSATDRYLGFRAMLRFHY